ncbi:MAG: AIM24 family protein [Candidatus Magnetoovum sp. WYHC-5]|nr:AIM24 family protein [Candidatus Magnetoovum sp. WYHC-5]
MPTLMVPQDKLDQLINKRERFEKFQRRVERNILELIPSNDEIMNYCQVVKKLEEEEEDTDRIWDIISDKQFLKIMLDDNHVVLSESGKLVYRHGNVTDKLKTNIGTQKNLKKMFINLLFKPYVISYEGNGEIGFAGDVPGEIALLSLKAGESIVAQRNTFLASIGDVDYSIDIEHSGIGSFILGEGMFLSRITNVGEKDALVFLYSCGGWELIDLKDKPLIVAGGAVVAWEGNVQYSILTNNAKRGIFGGEGMFMNKLSGPGKVLVQSLTLDKLQLKIGDTICLGPLPIMVWQYVQKNIKSAFYSILR